MALVAAMIVALGLILYYGYTPVITALSMAGWHGLFLLTLAYIPSLILCGLAWGSLMPLRWHSLRLFLLARWVRDAAASLLPVVPVSGELAGMRVLCNHGTRGHAALASTILDLTIELATQCFFMLIVLIILVSIRPMSPVIHWSILGLLLSVPLLSGFIVAQNFWLLPTLGRLTKQFAAPLLQALPQMDFSRLQKSVHAFYRDRRRLGMAFLLHLLAWFAGTLEAWVALHLLAAPRSLEEVMVLEGLVFALRTGAFFVPAGLGIQEGAYVAMGALLSLPPPIALAVSLLKRGRELLVGIPGLCWWQWEEGRRVRLRQGNVIKNRVGRW